MNGHLSTKMTKVLIAAVFGASFLSAGLAQSAKIIKVASVEASAPLAMTVGGRVLVEKDPAHPAFGAKKYIYQWPGTYFTASFRGTEAYFGVGEGKQILHVAVDRQRPVVLVRPDSGIYHISGLTDDVHTVLIEVVTESQAEPNSFGGFSLPPSASPLPAPHAAREIVNLIEQTAAKSGTIQRRPNQKATRGPLADRGKH